MSMSGNSCASLSTFLLSDKSAATVSTRTLAFCTIADFAAASASALRDTMIRLQPSCAKTSAVARPMPFEPPVISAVLPASLRSMGFSVSRVGTPIPPIFDEPRNMLAAIEQCVGRALDNPPLEGPPGKGTPERAAAWVLPYGPYCGAGVGLGSFVSSALHLKLAARLGSPLPL